MNPEAVEEQLKAVKRLVIAGNAFDAARLLCTHIENLGSQTFTLLHVPLFAGICVTYMKPFGRCDGLGRLPVELKTFPSGSKHEKIHDDLSKLRDCFYAHRDALKVPKLLSNPASAKAFNDITLHIEPGGTHSFLVNEVTWPFESISHVRDLCSFQRSRVDSLLAQHISTLLEAKAIQPGDYVLGDDFP